MTKKKEYNYGPIKAALFLAFIFGGVIALGFFTNHMFEMIEKGLTKTKTGQCLADKDKAYESLLKRVAEECWNRDQLIRFDLDTYVPLHCQIMYAPSVENTELTMGYQYRGRGRCYE